MKKLYRPDFKLHIAKVLLILGSVWCCAATCPDSPAQEGAQLYHSGNAGSVTYGSVGYGSVGTGLGTGTYTPILAQAPSYSATTTYPGTATFSPVTTGQVAPSQAILSQSPTTVSPYSPYTPQTLDPYAVSRQVWGNPAANSGGVAVGGVGNNNPYNPYNSGSQNVYSGNLNRFVPETYDAMKRFRQATAVSFTYIPAGKVSGSMPGEKSVFGMSEFDIRMQLAIPCKILPEYKAGPTYFFLAPGGSLVWWSGPMGPPDMPANGFSAYADIGVAPQFDDVFSMKAWIRLGLFSDFEKVNSDGFRIQGRVEGQFRLSPQVSLVGGVLYLGRERIKWLPVGGIVWKPQDDWLIQLTFPNPKISKRLWNSGCAEWWGYVHADYGGECWAITGIGKTDYNDIRVGGGVEFETTAGVGGHVELGGCFNRELYSNGQSWAKPKDAIYLKVGILF